MPIFRRSSSVAKTVKQAFNEYKTNLEITDRQSMLVASTSFNVVAALAAELSLHPDEKSKLIGSYDRHTLTRYLREGDIDLMVILHYGNNKAWDTNGGTIKALDRFKDILDRAYPNTTKRRDRNCITMKFSEFRLDVVPAFKVSSTPTDFYKIPDSVRQQWVPTDPSEFAREITAINQNMDGTFVPLLKMVKGWNRNVGWPIRSFHLECMMHRHYQSYTKSYTYSSTLKVFFGALPGYLSSACYDPVRRDRVDTYLDNDAQKTKRQVAIEKAKAASAASKEAYDDEENYPSVAIREWKSLLGEFFPNYG